MNILIVHNKYKQNGGEDVVVENETKLLGEMGYILYLGISGLMTNLTVLNCFGNYYYRSLPYFQ